MNPAVSERRPYPEFENETNFEKFSLTQENEDHIDLGLPNRTDMRSRLLGIQANANVPGPGRNKLKPVQNKAPPSLKTEAIRHLTGDEKMGKTNLAHRRTYSAETTKRQMTLDLEKSRSNNNSHALQVPDRSYKIFEQFEEFDLLNVENTYDEPNRVSSSQEYVDQIEFISQPNPKEGEACGLKNRQGKDMLSIVVEDYGGNATPIESIIPTLDFQLCPPDVGVSFKQKKRSKSWCGEIEQAGNNVPDGCNGSSPCDLTEQHGSPLTRFHQKMWKTFKTKAKEFRSRSKERHRKPKAARVAQLDRSDTEASLSDMDCSALFHVNLPDIQNTQELRPMQSEERSLSESIVAEARFPFSRSPSESRESESDSGITLIETTQTSALRQRHNALRSHPFFQLDVLLIEGRDLVVRDTCGTSDPYVKFKIGGKQYYKSRRINRNLNPRWDEKFTLPIEDPFKRIQVKVLDYDRAMNDDPMGSAEIDPSTLDLNVPTELKLNLSEKTTKVRRENMGYLLVQCTLIPKSQDEKEQRSLKSGDSKKLKTQSWSGVVTIILVEGRHLLAMDDNGFSDPYVKFKLGNEKYKSKCKSKTLNPRWLEQCDLHMFEDQSRILEISVWDYDMGGKDDIMGRTSIDLSLLPKEKTKMLDLILDDGGGTLQLLITISGTTGSEAISHLGSNSPNPKERQDLINKYNIYRSFSNWRDVGWLQVKVIKAQGLASADLGGKSDPFCVLELINSRVQTQTEYKTLEPIWNKVFTFDVSDIHSTLEVTVYDEDRDHRSEFLGKVAIPLLNINNGERKWYGLKDKKLLGRAKGAIQLEMDLVFNQFKAAIRTLNPKLEKYLQPEAKCKVSIMKRNIDRVSRIVQAGVDTKQFIQSCFDWESTPRTLTVFSAFVILTCTIQMHYVPLYLILILLFGKLWSCTVPCEITMVFLLTVWNFELYMLPVIMLCVFLKNLLMMQVSGNLMKDKEETVSEYIEDDDDEDDDDKEKEEKKSFKEKLHTIQDVCLQVQEGMDMIASLGERIKNTFNWTVPWLSWLGIVALAIGAVVLYYIPLRCLILVWGINKFTKKLRAENSDPTSELMDYLSRVPSDRELVMYREFRPDPAIFSGKKKRS